jgi:hypothetical protein
MESRRRQGGLTMLGFLFVAGVLVVCAMVGFRVTPAYIEAYSVQKALQASLNETPDLNNAAELRKAFNTRVDAGYITSVRGNDIELRREGGEFVASIVWSRKLPLVANVSLLIDFDVSVRR